MQATQPRSAGPDGILACWPCTAPAAWELHCISLHTSPIARPQNLPVQRPTASRLATRERDRESAQTQPAGRLPTAIRPSKTCLFSASNDPASETAAELALQQGWLVRKYHSASGGLPKLSLRLREHPTYGLCPWWRPTPHSAERLAGLRRRWAKYVWWRFVCGLTSRAKKI